MQKKFMTYDQQIDRLKKKKRGYENNLKNPTTKKYKDGPTFEDIVALYFFDEELRELDRV